MDNRTHKLPLSPSYSRSAKTRAMDSTFTPATVVFAVLSFLLYAIAVNDNGGPSPHTLRLSCLSLITLCLALVGFSRRRGRDVERPPVLAVGFTLLYALYFGIGTFAWSNRDNPSWGLPLAISAGAIEHTVHIAEVGILSWTAGLAFSSRRKTVRRQHKQVSETLKILDGPLPSAASIGIVYAIGLGARLFTVLTGSFGYIVSDLNKAVTNPNPLLGIVSRFEGLTLVALLMLVIRRASIPKDVSTYWLFMFVVASEVLFALYSGTKVGLFLRIGFLLVGFWLVKRRLPWKILTVAVILFVPFLLFTGAYRDQVRNGSSNLAGASAAALLAPTIRQVARDSSDLSTVQDTMSRFVFQRFRGIDGPAMVVERTPGTIPYISASSSVLVPIGSFIPRFLWHGKPVYIDGLEFARQYFGQGTEAFNSLTPTMLGDLYRRGGLIVVVVGMWALGWLSGFLTTFFSIGLSPQRFAVFAPFAIELLNLESGFALLPVSLVQLGFVTLIGVRLAYRRTPHSRDLQRR
jgi:hypothetical protein